MKLKQSEFNDDHSLHHTWGLIGKDELMSNSRCFQDVKSGFISAVTLGNKGRVNDKYARVYDAGRKGGIGYWFPHEIFSTSFGCE